MTQQQDPPQTLFSFMGTKELPVAFYRRLREECPVYFDPMLQGNLLTRYTDVVEVLSNADVYRLQSRPEEQYEDSQTDARVATFRAMLSAKTCSRYVDTVLKPEIDRLLARVLPAGKMELYSALADPLPSNLIASLFGLEPSDFEDFIAYRNARIAVFNAPPGDTAVKDNADDWQKRIDARMREVIEDHRRQPRDNLLTWLLDAKEEGASIPEDQVMQIVVRDLLIAGSETVGGGILNATFNLLTQPGMLESLRSDTALVQKFVDEALRYDPPVPVFWRAPKTEVELSGCPLKPGTQLFPVIGAANRDPEKFPEPDEFRLDRPGGQHVAFSIGPHRCPGAWLGRTQIELALEALITKLPGLRLDPDAPPPVSTGVVTRNWRPLHLLFDRT